MGQAYGRASVGSGLVASDMMGGLGVAPSLTVGPLWGRASVWSGLVWLVMVGGLSVEDEFVLVCGDFHAPACLLSDVICEVVCAFFFTVDYEEFSWRLP